MAPHMLLSSEWLAERLTFPTTLARRTAPRSSRRATGDGGSTWLYDWAFSTTRQPAISICRNEEPGGPRAVGARQRAPVIHTVGPVLHAAVAAGDDFAGPLMTWPSGRSLADQAAAKRRAARLRVAPTLRGSEAVGSASLAPTGHARKIDAEKIAAVGQAQRDGIPIKSCISMEASGQYRRISRAVTPPYSKAVCVVDIGSAGSTGRTPMPKSRSAIQIARLDHPLSCCVVRRDTGTSTPDVEADIGNRSLSVVRRVSSGSAWRAGPG